MVASNTLHCARLLKADTFPGWRRMHKAARFACRRCRVFLPGRQNGKLNQQLAGYLGRRLNVS
jgi:hypothetical protein